jgi:hypothetical protein
LHRKYGDNVALVALAVESPEDKVRETAKSLSPGLRHPPAPTLSAISHPCRRWSFSIALEKLPAFSTALHVEAEKSLDALVK